MVISSIGNLYIVPDFLGVVLVVDRHDMGLVRLLVIEDLEEVDIGKIDTYLRQDELMTGTLLQVNQLDTSTISHKHEVTIETRSWDQIHSHGHVTIIVAPNFDDFARVKESASSGPLDHGEEVAFEKRNKELVSPELYEVIRLPILAVMLLR